MSASSRWSVGIDLGTTNSTLAQASLDDAAEAAGQRPEPMAVPQVVHPGEVEARDRLPSFLYLPSSSEGPPERFSPPWGGPLRCCPGELARNRGAEVPGRVVSSAKSWLCHGGVDRRAPLLPLGAPDDVEKLSPVAASAAYLGHLRAAWDAVHADAPLADQDIVLTVPASFDAVARALTEEAAAEADLERLTLLEEPQAALYAWLAERADTWREQLEVGDVVLVVDLGGGTTDFSIVLVGEEEGHLSLERIAVGAHILLGGDNMDLALAYLAKGRIEADGGSVDDHQLRGLTHSCRAAKENLLENPSLAEQGVAAPGRGRKLIGGGASATLTRADVEEVIVEGFFPEVAVTARPQRARTTALTTLGLPYAADAAITKHLAAFLGGPALSGAVPRGIDPSAGFVKPTAVLFNGGVTRAAPLRGRVVDLLDAWLAKAGAAPVKVLAADDPDGAVSRGAAYFGQVRRGQGIRIKGGTQRAYYVGIERAELAVPGIPPQVDAVCIAPFGMEEGTELTLPQELGLVLDEGASFRFWSSTARREDAAAATINPAAHPDELEELPPVEVRAMAGEAEPGAGQPPVPDPTSGMLEVIPVRLSSKLTDLGTLELAAVEIASGRRHRLEFDVRQG